MQAAEAARLRSETAAPETRNELQAACAGLVRAFREQLQSQADKTLLLEDAVILDAAIELLCPPPAEK